MKLFLTSIAVFVLLLGIQSPAAASSITYVESATASGTIGTTTFTDALVTVTLSADTSGVTPFDLGAPVGTILYNLGSATVKISGVGTATLTQTMGIYIFNGAQALVISGGQISTPVAIMASGSLLDDSWTGLILITDSGLAGYNLQTPVNITGQGGLCCISAEHTTSMGDLSFRVTPSNPLISDNNVGAVTTITTSVPEPSSVLLLGVGALFLFVVRRQRIPSISQHR